ncbi:MAG: F0F1 ATP synthase subunit epsilon [Elusimicrobiota bacterium]
MIYLEIITPDKVVYKDEVDFIVLPAAEGELGVEPGHTYYLTSLKTGEMRVKKKNEWYYLALSSGFADISSSKVTVLAETAELAEQINYERALQAKLQALEKLKERKGPAEIKMVEIEAALQRALARLKVVETIRQKKR